MNTKTNILVTWIITIILYLLSYSVLDYGDYLSVMAAVVVVATMTFVFNQNKIWCCVAPVLIAYSLAFGAHWLILLIIPVLLVIAVMVSEHEKRHKREQELSQDDLIIVRRRDIKRL